MEKRIKIDYRADLRRNEASKKKKVPQKKDNRIKIDDTFLRSGRGDEHPSFDENTVEYSEGPKVHYKDGIWKPTPKSNRKLEIMNAIKKKMRRSGSNVYTPPKP